VTKNSIGIANFLNGGSFSPGIFNDFHEIIPGTKIAGNTLLMLGPFRRRASRDWRNRSSFKIGDAYEAFGQIGVMGFLRRVADHGNGAG
jgi:hypothetical protein